MIVIDQISANNGNVTTLSTSHLVKSQDSVLVLLWATNLNRQSTATFNGVALNQVRVLQSGGGASIWYMRNPPVGIYDLLITNTGADSTDVIILSLTGVSRKNNFFSSNQAAINGTTAKIEVQAPVANSLVLDLLVGGTNPTGSIAGTGQTPIYMSTTNANVVASVKTNVQGSAIMSWAIPNQISDYVAIAIEPDPDPAPSISYPNISTQGAIDVITTNGLNTSFSPGIFSYGNKPSTFFLNSNLHTLGRFSGINSILTYRERALYNKTSQIIITNVSATNSGGGAASTLITNHTINSLDEVLLVIVGAGTATVTAGGVPVPLLSPAGAIEMFYLSNPPLGKITVTSAFASAVSAMTVISMLGIDKTKNPITNSITSAVTNRTVTIVPTAANSIIIDAANGSAPTEPLFGEQRQISIHGGAKPMAVSFKIGGISEQIMGWVDANPGSVLYLVAAFAPLKPIGLRTPSINFNSVGDVIGVNSLDNAPVASGGKVETTQNVINFYKNSFLHTIGRLTSGFGPQGIAFDLAGNSGDIAAANSFSGNATWNGSNRILTVDVSMLGAGVTVTAMTYGGATCTFVGAQSTVTSFGRIEQWRIIQSDSGAPAAGANTLAVTLSGSLEFSVEWVSYTGVHQTSPTEGFNSAQATNAGSADNATVNITTVADNDWVHAAVVANDTSITAGNTTRNNISGTLGSGGNEDNNAPKTPAGSVTMFYTGMGITTTWAIAGYALRPIAASSLGGGGGNDWPTFQVRGFWGWRF